jgi:ankyrin repeat protein
MQSEVLELLLAYEGIQVTMENEDGNTPLHYFCRCFASPTCQTILQVLLSFGADPNKPNQVCCFISFRAVT